MRKYQMVRDAIRIGDINVVRSVVGFGHNDMVGSVVRFGHNDMVGKFVICIQLSAHNRIGCSNMEMPVGWQENYGKTRGKPWMARD